MKRFVIPAILFALTGVANASYSLNEVLTELQTKEKTISVIRFNFEQDIQFTQMNQRSNVTGQAMFGKPGKLRITKKKPDQQETISDGKNVWVYNPAFNQVWKGSAKKWMDSSVLPKGIIPIDNYVEELKKNFILKMLPDGSAGPRISAEPRDKAFEYRLELLVSPESWLPVETTYISQSARVVTKCSNHEVNPQIKADAFKFVAPKGVDVIPLN